MFSDQIVHLITTEQDRQQGGFISDVELGVYLKKLSEKAEVVAHYDSDLCKGFVAYYCNDMLTKSAFITLVLIDPSVRGLGLGKILVCTVLKIMKSRRFESCRLEVKKDNATARQLYQNLGFVIAEDNGEKYTLEVGLVDF